MLSIHILILFSQISSNSTNHQIISSIIYLFIHSLIYLFIYSFIYLFIVIHFMNSIRALRPTDQIDHSFEVIGLDESEPRQWWCDGNQFWLSQLIRILQCQWCQLSSDVWSHESHRCKYVKRSHNIDGSISVYLLTHPLDHEIYQLSIVQSESMKCIQQTSQLRWAKLIHQIEGLGANEVNEFNIGHTEAGDGIHKICKARGTEWIGTSDGELGALGSEGLSAWTVWDMQQMGQQFCDRLGTPVTDFCRNHF